MAGHVDRRHREPALRHQATGTAQDIGGLFVLAAAVSHQDEGPSTGGAFRRPQHTGHAIEDEDLFAGATGRRLRGEAVTGDQAADGGHGVRPARLGGEAAREVTGVR